MNVFDVIVDMVPSGATVLDLGCDDCTLLERLHNERQVRGRGVDIDDRSIQECIRKGISVFHGNLDEGLKDHPTGSYDYVILSRTLQQVRKPHLLLDEMVRVGRQVIVNFPNFASLINRIQLGLGGRMPVNKNIPYSWYDTPNIHFFTRNDFVSLCREREITILREVILYRQRIAPPVLPNLLATEVCCLITKDGSAV
ncbi:MAG: methionine biosynthesis protein MetW [Alkalispirochaeta sp.]